MTIAVEGAREDWAEARRRRKRLQKIRAQEAEESEAFDAVIGRLGEQNSGYTIAKALNMERPTVARILARVNGK